MQIILTTQGGLVKTSVVNSNPHKKPAKRGNVKGFSGASRKRLMEKCARVGKVGKAIFITVTYGQQFPEWQEAKKHLHVFLQQIRRSFPDAAGFWRYEEQDRGAPHFHFMFFNLPFWQKEKLKKVWGRIIGQKYWDRTEFIVREPFTRIELIRTKRKAMRYVAKYIAKNAGEKEVTPQSHGGFNNPSYMNEAGRQWGVHNEANMPYGEEMVIRVTISNRDYGRFRAYAEAVWEGIKKYELWQGWTLFVNDASVWVTLLLRAMKSDNVASNATCV